MKKTKQNFKIALLVVLLLTTAATSTSAGTIYFWNGCVDVIKMKETTDGVFYTTSDGNSWITAAKVEHYSSDGNCPIPPIKEPCSGCGKLTLRGVLCDKCMAQEF